MPMSVKTSFLFAALFLVISGVLFCVGMLKSKHCTEKTSAIIDNIINRNGLTTYVFRYTINGREFVREHKTGTTSNPYKLGDTLTVRYNPKSPTSILPTDKNNIYTYAFAFLILGGICLVSGCCFFLPGVGNVAGK